MRVLRKIKNSFYLYFKKYLNDLNLIGSKVSIGKNVYLKGAILSGDIRLGDNSKIYHANLDGTINIGKNTSIWGPNVVFVSGINKIEIGNYCSIARNVIFQEYNHNLNRFTTYYVNKNVLKIAETDIVSKGSIVVGHDVWIGANAVILSGAQIGTGAVIAANSVVSGKVPPYAIVGGVPAKVLKYRFPIEIQKQLIDFRWWELDEVELIKRIPELDEIVKETTN